MSQLAGFSLGGAAGAAAGRSGSIFDILAPLDYARQAAWNLPSALSKGDILGALPGILGAGAGLGLAATGVGLPLALLGGSVAGGLAQGLGRSTGSESFDAPTPGHLVQALGMDPESWGGMAAGMGLGVLGDPLTYAGGAFGRAAGKGLAQRAAVRGMLETPALEGMPADLLRGATRAGATPAELEQAAQQGFVMRNRELGSLVGQTAGFNEYARGMPPMRFGPPEVPPVPPVPPAARPFDPMSVLPTAPGGKFSLEETRNIEGQLWDLLQEKPLGYEPQAAALVRQLRMRGIVHGGVGSGLPGEIAPTRPWTIGRSTPYPTGFPGGLKDPFELRDQLRELHRDLTTDALAALREHGAAGGLPPSPSSTLPRTFEQINPRQGALLAELSNVGGTPIKMGELGQTYWNLPGVRSPAVNDLLERFGVYRGREGPQRLLDMLAARGSDPTERLLLEAQGGRGIEEMLSLLRSPGAGQLPWLGQNVPHVPPARLPLPTIAPLGPESITGEQARRLMQLPGEALRSFLPPGDLGSALAQSGLTRAQVEALLARLQGGLP
jgi:hypothetical protein